MDDLLRQIGNRILGRRKQLRMTQEELAEKAGITPQTVSSAELGKKALRPENIIRVCSALDISTDYLLLGETNASDHSILLTKISDLPPIQYRHLEDIINRFILALEEKKFISLCIDTDMSFFNKKIKNRTDSIFTAMSCFSMRPLPFWQTSLGHLKQQKHVFCQ